MNLRVLFIGLWLGSATMAQAAGTTDTDKLLDTCRACHGAKGEGNPALFAPALAGQRPEYLARQLSNFKVGKRGYHRDDAHGNTMRAIAKPLSDGDIIALANHFAHQLPPAPVAGNAAAAVDIVAGKVRYLGTCAMCHGEKAEGYAQLQSPALRGLAGDYLTAQMAGYVKGWRGDAGDYDQPSQWMRSIAAQVSDPVELANIVAYITTLR